MTLRMLRCNEMTAFLDAYLADELSAQVRGVFERHLDLCEACVRYLEQYRRAIALGRAAFEDDRAATLPDDLVEAILRAVDATDPDAPGG